MTLKRSLAVIVGLLGTSVLLAQGETPQVSLAESSAFRALTDAMVRTRQGGANPTEDDLKVRRESGREMATKAKAFLNDYPASKQADDARSLWSLGLFNAAVAGDPHAADELASRADEFVQDPRIPEMLKLHTYSINFLAQWARKNGKRTLDESSAEFQKANVEAFFAAADVLPDKEPVFKMLLLLARSGKNLSPEDKRSIAQRLLDDPRTSPAIRAEAGDILSGKQAYAIGKPLEISFVAVDGRKVNLADLKGKVILVDFWATWCGPCVAEVPAIKKVYDEFHARGFEIVGISLDDDKDTLIHFAKEHEMTWPQYFDGKHWNNDISSRFGINAVPTQWLVDKHGILRDTNARGDLEQAVERLLKEE